MDKIIKKEKIFVKEDIGYVIGGDRLSSLRLIGGLEYNMLEFVNEKVYI